MICKYVDKNLCKATNEICPYMNYCDKIKGYKPSRYMPENCPVKKRASCPPGYYPVRQERKGYLYVDIDDVTHKIKNPFDIVPEYVQARKYKNGTIKLKL